MTTWWLEPVTTLAGADEVLERIRTARLAKVVALVGYHDDAEAGAVAKKLPYGHRGEGIEEIVFCRTGPPTGEVVEFEDDAWPGEDRTFVADDLGRALDLTLEFAVEYGAERAVVIVVGTPDFLAAVADRAGLET